jgi:FdhE protein
VVKGSVPRIVADPGEIGRVANPPFLVLPDAAQVFSRRAARLATLAPGNPFGAFLSFTAAITRAQQAALAQLPPPPGAAAPAASTLRDRLDSGAMLAGSQWRDALAAIAANLAPVAMPGEAAAALAALLARPEDECAAFAARVLDRRFAVEEGPEALFVAAALQAAWTRETGAVAANAAAARETIACPVCSGLPVASLVYATGERQGLRYLVCSLCAAEWRHVRIKCTACGESKGIAYHSVAGQEGPAKAETCPECRAYMKILYAEKDTAAEPFADDLASLALDVLMTDSGWRRAYPNPFLVPGIA